MNMNMRYLVISCMMIILVQGIVDTATAVPTTDRNIIVGFNHPVGSKDDSVIQSHGGFVKKNFHLIPAIVATIPEARLAELKNDPNVLYVENDSIFKIADSYSDEYNNSWGVQRIGSQPAYDHGINGAGVNVSVLDTGIDYNNSDLKDNYKGGYDFVRNDSNPDDENCLTQDHTCHGTHVSGIIGAERNGYGVVGVAPNVNLYAVKVLGPDGTGTTSWIISGIEWSVDHKMNIISMSLAGPDDIAMHNALDTAYYTDGLLLVAAAGNTFGGFVTYPAAYDSVIAVTATDKADQNASFSPIDPKIELAAPGVDINSTIGVAYGSYGLRSGTSMATPHVTGVAALIESQGITNNVEVRSILDNTARDLGAQGRDSIYGFGLVDAQNATLGIPTIPPAPPISFIPPDPINLQNVTGKTWVNYTWSPGIGNITDSYNVSANGIWYNGTVDTYKNISITPDGWANITVWAYNSSGTGLLSLGSIGRNIHINNFDNVQITLIRDSNPPIADSKTVNLSQGNYEIIVNNTNLTELDMNVYDNITGSIIKSLSQKFVFNGTFGNNGNVNLKKLKIYPNNIDTYLNSQKSVKVVFIPYGNIGTTCNVTIIKTN